MAKDTINTSPAEAYGTLDQAQRTQLAQECISQLRPEDDPECQRFAHADVSAITPEQLAALHEHVGDHHPAVLEALLRHPMLTGALTALVVRQLNRYLHNS